MVASDDHSWQTVGVIYVAMAIYLSFLDIGVGSHMHVSAHFDFTPTETKVTGEISE